MQLTHLATTISDPDNLKADGRGQSVTNSLGHLDISSRSNSRLGEMSSKIMSFFGRKNQQDSSYTIPVLPPVIL